MSLAFALALAMHCMGQSPVSSTTGNRTLQIGISAREGRLSQEWLSALTSRVSPQVLDSFAALQREPLPGEVKWSNLIMSKVNRWNSFRDSLGKAFGNPSMPDSIFVMLGYFGNDDGFTYRLNTVCLDVTALHRAYGDADHPDNDSRIDRIFSHEYTHLLHKDWAKRTGYVPVSFRDSIWWECLYEGIGMYRSLNDRWLPVDGGLPEVTTRTLAKLVPVFKERMHKANSATVLTTDEKRKLQQNLSRGRVPEKWGAFPVAIWFALEAAGDDSRLQYWMNKGPAGIPELAGKYDSLVSGL
jgi:hypothetical protein